MATDQKDKIKDKATKEDGVDVQISIRKVKERALVVQIRDKELVVQIRDKELAAQIRVRMVKVLKVAAQIRERALVVQTRVRMVRESKVAAQIRVRMDRESKVAVQNSRKTSLVLKELKDSWNSLLPNVKKRTWSACKSSLTLSLNC